MYGFNFTTIYFNPPNKMNQFIVNFQLLRDSSKNILLRELAICGIEKDDVIHHTIKSPEQWNTLSRPEKFQKGELITQDAALAHLKNVLKNAEAIYVKGSERVWFVSKQLSNSCQIIDLDDVGCPKTSKLPLPKDAIIMKPNHINHRFCSLKQALRFKQWLIDNPHILYDSANDGYENSTNDTENDLDDVVEFSNKRKVTFLFPAQIHYIERQ